ncbi:MAG: hypothetical protein ACX94C_11775 [Phycisphaerales bacterium]
MGVTISGSRMVNIGNSGYRLEIDTRNADLLTVTVPAASLLGSAVFELKRLDSLQPYSPAKTIGLSTPSIIAADVRSIDKAVLELTTADSAERDLRVEWFGEEEA